MKMACTERTIRVYAVQQVTLFQHLKTPFKAMTCKIDWSIAGHGSMRCLQTPAVAGLRDSSSLPDMWQECLWRVSRSGPRSAKEFEGSSLKKTEVIVTVKRCHAA